MTYDHVRHTNTVFDHYHFSSEGFSCKVFPNLGGSIQELTLNNVNLIKEIAMDDGGLEHYQTYYPSAVLFPFPNRIADGKYSFEEEQFQLPINESNFKNAIHGLVTDKHFVVQEIDHCSISLQFTHRTSHGFPFPFEFVIRYVFTETELNLKYEVTNSGQKIFPFGMGWHPYFELGNYENCNVEFSAMKTYVNDEKMIPVDSEAYNMDVLSLAEAKLDNAYQLQNGHIQMNSPNYLLKMEVPKDSYLQLYTPQNRASLAIEPMTCIADSFNNGVGLKQLSPGCNYEFETIVSVHRPK